jgi:hypothetical protein
VGAKCAFKIFFRVAPPWSHIGKKMLMFEEYQSIVIFFCEGPIQVAYCKKKKIAPTTN